MQHFSTWLDARLHERGWSAADLVRASRDPEHPRGFDPGLVSRWRKPPPLGVIPSPGTLRRIARTFGVPVADAYHAAGFIADDEPEAAPSNVTRIEAFIRARAERLAAALEATEGLPDFAIEAYLGKHLDRAEEDILEGVQLMRRLEARAAATAAAGISTGHEPEETTDERVANNSPVGGGGEIARSQRPVSPTRRRPADALAA